MSTAWDRRCCEYCIKLNEFERMCGAFFNAFDSSGNCKNRHHIDSSSSCALARTMQCGAVWVRKWGSGPTDLAEGRPVNLIESNDRADVKLKLTFCYFLTDLRFVPSVFVC
jgi:hypothetical protein